MRSNDIVKLNRTLSTVGLDFIGQTFSARVLLINLKNIRRNNIFTPGPQISTVIDKQRLFNFNVIFYTFNLDKTILYIHISNSFSLSRPIILSKTSSIVLNNIMIECIDETVFTMSNDGAF